MKIDPRRKLKFECFSLWFINWKCAEWKWPRFLYRFIPLALFMASSVLSVSEHRRLVRTPSRGCTRGFGHSKAATAVSSLVKERDSQKIMTILMTSLWSVWVRRCVNIQREVALGLSYPLRWNAENVYDGASVTCARMRQGAEGDRSQYRSLEGWFEQ